MRAETLGSMNLAFMGFAFTLSAILFSTEAISGDRSVIPGRWTSLEQECANPTDGVVNVSQTNISASEYGCELFGGDTSDPRHWTMRGRCQEAGEYEDGRQPPLTQIELVERNGVLSILIGTSEPWKLAIKCP